MTKRRLVMCLCCLCITVVSVCTACQSKEEGKIITLLTADNDNYLNVFTSDRFKMLYGTATDGEKVLLNTLLNELSVITCDNNKDDKSVFSVEIKLPDLDSVIESAISDSGYQTDLQKMVLTEEDSTAIYDFALRFVSAKVLAVDGLEQTISGSLRVSNNTIVEFEAIEQYLVDALVSMHGLQDQISIDVDSMIAPISDNGDVNSRLDEPFECTVIPEGGAFVFSKDKVRYLVYDVSVLVGDDAYQKIESISDVNASFSSTNLWYVSCKIKALKKGSFKVQSGFVLTNDVGEVYDSPSNFVVTGIKDSLVLDGEKEYEMSTCLIGPKDSSLIWQTENGKGTYKIILDTAK